MPDILIYILAVLGVPVAAALAIAVLSLPVKLFRKLRRRITGLPVATHSVALITDSGDEIRGDDAIMVPSEFGGDRLINSNQITFPPVTADATFDRFVMRRLCKDVIGAPEYCGAIINGPKTMTAWTAPIFEPGDLLISFH